MVGLFFFCSIPASYSDVVFEGSYPQNSLLSNTHHWGQCYQANVLPKKKKTAARAALKRKKQHEHSLSQTQSQVSQLEQQIYSIESANINYETLKAMESAGKAMKAIRGGITMEKVDSTMYVYHFLLCSCKTLPPQPHSSRSNKNN